MKVKCKACLYRAGSKCTLMDTELSNVEVCNVTKLETTHAASRALSALQLARRKVVEAQNEVYELESRVCKRFAKYKQNDSVTVTFPTGKVVEGCRIMNVKVPECVTALKESGWLIQNEFAYRIAQRVSLQWIVIVATNCEIKKEN